MKTVMSRDFYDLTCPTPELDSDDVTDLAALGAHVISRLEIEALIFPTLDATYSEKFGTVRLPTIDCSSILLPYDISSHGDIDVNGSNIEALMTETVNTRLKGSKYLCLGERTEPLVLCFKKFSYEILWTLGRLFINTQQIVFNEECRDLFFFDPDHLACIVATKSENTGETFGNRSDEFWNNYFAQNYAFESPDVAILEKRLAIHFSGRYTWLRKIPAVKRHFSYGVNSDSYS